MNEYILPIVDESCLYARHCVKNYRIMKKTVLKSFESSWEKEIETSSYKVAGKRGTRGNAGCRQSMQVGGQQPGCGW